MIRWLPKLGLEYAVIAATLYIATVAASPAVYALAAFVLGTRQLAIATLGHDAVHGHAGDAGKALAFLCFWPMGFGRDAFCWQHFRHHQWPGNPALDPEMPLRQQNERARRFGRWLPLLDVFGYCLPQAYTWFFKVARPRSVADVLGPLAFAAALIAVSWQAAALWYGSLIVLTTITRQRSYTDHDGPLALTPVSRPALWRRVVYLPHGTWLHWEHHRWPAMPVHEQARRWAKQASNG